MRDRKKVIIGALVILAALAIVYIAGWLAEELRSAAEPSGDYRQRYDYEENMEYGGVNYRKKGSITSILILGIDREDELPAEGYRSGGQADLMQLLVVDSQSKTVKRLPIDRDTMADITVLGVFGDVAGTRNAQICLAHSFGDGQGRSCQLTVDAVSRLLSGVKIDYYMAVSLGAIGDINDLVGGVEVTLNEDLSGLDPAMAQGSTLTLHGNQAEFFVRSRMGVGDGTNEQRMARQEQYIAGFIDLLEERIRADKESAGQMYDALSSYVTTNLGRGTMVNLAWNAREYDWLAPCRIEGVHDASSGHMRFYADEDSVTRAVLELFYEPI